MQVRIAILLVAAVAFSAQAAANEAHPDCEDGQANRAEGSPWLVCEGEHWDGQDATDSSCGSTGADFNAQTACAAVNGGPEPPEPQLVPLLSARASVRYADGPGVYTSQGAWGVGTQAVWVGADGVVSWYGKDNTNQIAPTGTPVFEPVIAAINDDAEEGGADGNIVAWIVGYGAQWGVQLAAFKTGESDCGQTQYEASDCARDNTALTVELVP